MLSRILQTINTNVRELSGRQPSPISAIPSKATVSGDHEHNLEDLVTLMHIPTNLSDQEYADDETSRLGEIDVNQLSTSCQQKLDTLASLIQSSVVVIPQLPLKADGKDSSHDTQCLDDFDEKTSSKSDRPITERRKPCLMSQATSVTGENTNLIDGKRKITHHHAPTRRKRQRGPDKTKATTIPSHPVDVRSDKSKPRWCRRCGITETCRWRTSPAGSQTACNACHLKCKIRGLPDTEFEKFLVCPVDLATETPRSIAVSIQQSKKTSHVRLEVNAPISKTDTKLDSKPKKMATGKIMPMRCGVTECGATTSPMWRKGPDGTTSLCNKCGIRWAKGKYPELASSSVKPQPKMTTSPKPVKDSAASHSKEPELQYTSIKQKKQCRSTVLLKNGNLPVSERKVFLEAGLYSNQNKIISQGRQSKAMKGVKDFVFSLPEHYGELLMNKVADFRLSFDIIEAHQNGLIGEEAEERKRQRLNPDSFVRIRSNIFVERKHNRVNKESPVCQCVMPADGTPGCNEDCLNRLLFYECDVRTCPCEKLCSNQRFRRKEEVGELKVFWTDERGWGLRTLTDIKRGQLIIEYRGEVISQRLCEERVRTVYVDKKNFYFLDYQNGEVIDAAAKGSDARFVNHSCDPNCHIEKWAIGGEICVGVMASIDIPAGSELFYDYNYTVFGSGIRQRCRCGSVNCRGFIGKKRGGRDSTA